MGTHVHGSLQNCITSMRMFHLNWKSSKTFKQINPVIQDYVQMCSVPSPDGSWSCGTTQTENEFDITYANRMSFTRGTYSFSIGQCSKHNGYLISPGFLQISRLISHGLEQRRADKNCIQMTKTQTSFQCLVSKHLLQIVMSTFGLRSCKNYLTI